MTDRLDLLTARLRAKAIPIANRLGYTEPMALEAQREVLWWLAARLQAARTGQRLLQGRAVAWGGAGYAELAPVEVPRPGPGKVTVLLEASAISPGTERAQYLGLPNADRGPMAAPGYSGAGRVVAAGCGVTSLTEGDVVAVSGARHASVVTVPASDVHRVPADVPLPAAALVHFGIICGQAVRLSRLGPGDEFCLIGCGLIGLLTQRLAVAAGARCIAAVATSRRREPLALAGPADRFLTLDDDSEIERVSAHVVLEATGDPAAIGVALAAAAPGGRVLLVGSPRGTSELPAAELRERGLRLVGAHVRTLDVEFKRTGANVKHDLAESFLALLADGRLDVADLVGEAVDPRDAAVFYRRLARDRALTSAHFDWTRLPQPERLAPGRIVRLPDIAGRGMDSRRRPLPTKRRLAAKSAEDPFRGASGRLRVGLVGCGDIGMHNAAAAAAAPNVELVAAFDPRASLAHELAARYGAAVSPSLESLVERHEVDAVFLCVPHHLHAPLALTAIEHGRHVIVEKPQASDLAGALEMTRAARDAGVVLSVCFPQRYQPEVVLAKRLLDAGALGELGGAGVSLFLDKTPGYWLGGFSGRSPSTWRSSRARAGGGVLIMNLSHYVDLVRHLGGVELEEVTAAAGSVDEQMEVEDTITIGARFANGALGWFVSSSAMRAADSGELRLWGRDGHVAVEPTGRVFTLKAIDGIRPGRWQTFGRLPAVPTRAVYLSRLGSAIHEGRAPDVTAEDGVAVQSFIEAAYRAAAEGRAVRPGELIDAAGGGS